MRIHAAVTAALVALVIVSLASQSRAASDSTCKADVANASAAASPAHKLLLIPGPIEFSEEVLAAAGGLATSHVDPSFVAEFGETLELLRKVFLAERGQPFVVSGSGTLGWDMVEPGQNVLVVNTGYFGDRFGETFEA
ncbi:uncharacterized protein HaLaN_16737 [Haematococcus lacustris]|uniref:Uncharacterized protein n=1 Tax=Haematococcus lacustris TaxID=44745 RepID=A0A699ZLP4_HAELA|nr:uncharacterized protein HaLaN_16737 [Haematococcus lacustris]